MPCTDLLEEQIRTGGAVILSGRRGAEQRGPERETD
jgi:hypothetical protein